MELKQLSCFLVTARWQHITRAAGAIGISQPALSRMIAQLEREVGTPLFDRKDRGICLNAAGECLRQHAERVFAELEDARRALRDLSDDDHGEIRLAVLVASALLPDLLGGFRSRHPNTAFQLVQHGPGSASDVAADVVITSMPVSIAGYRNTAVLTEEILLAVPRDHPLAGRESIRLEDAADGDFISLSPKRQLREMTDAMCRMAGFAPRIVFESDDPATVRGLIRAGQGIAFMPACTWGRQAGDAMVRLHIQSPRCERTIYLAHDASRYPSHAVRAFSRYAAEHIASFGEKKPTGDAQDPPA